MHDYYGEIVQSGIGKTIAKNLGLPTPVALERFEKGQSVLTGEVIAGFFGDDSNTVKDSILATLSDLHAHLSTDPATIAYAQDYQGTLADSTKKSKDEHSRFKVAIFDATNIRTLHDLQAVYDFFHPIAKKIKPSGRIIVIARPDCCTDTVEYTAAQTALTGFVKSVAKEFKRGISANILYLKKGLENELDGTLRFFMSPKSAYISGQAVYLTHDYASSSNTNLKGKKIVVTGASRGIGASICEVLSNEGASVVAVDLPTALSDLQKLAGQLGATALPLDITDPHAGLKLVEAVGQIDGIVHNAGITKDKTLANMTADKWQSVLAVNTIAVANINDYLLKNQALNQDGRIVCVSSISGIAGNLGQTNYATSKAGIIGLIKATAKTLAPTQTINAVAPGFIETKMTAQMPFAIREAGRRMNSMSQGGEPTDVAQAIAWLLAPTSGVINGQVVRVCGQSLLGA